MSFNIQYVKKKVFISTPKKSATAPSSTAQNDDIAWINKLLKWQVRLHKRNFLQYMHPPIILFLSKDDMSDM